MGLSPRNLWNMKLFYDRYKDSDQKLLRAVAVLQWGHNLLLINKKLSDDESYFYAKEAVNNHWNRNLLLNAIKMDSYSLSKNTFRDNNFNQTLPAIQAEQANEILKDSYNLGFLGVTQPLSELELEKRLMEKIKIFMLELGKGFAFIGNQYRLEYNGKEYFVDMLFTNRKLKCLVALELKIGEFKSEYVGKMNMYLSLLDKLEKEEYENQSIGIILCAEKDHLDVELALQDINKPIAVSDYELILPKKELQTLVMNELKLIEKEKSEQKK
jgi:predicted nuclease of restriction endonuclease-like (RecB) superfamily